MSRHVWQTKPTREKADKMLTAFKAALDAGFEPVIARCFAGYWIERCVQGLKQFYHDKSGFRFVQDTFQEFMQAAINGGHRYARGKNSANYSKVFAAHLPFWISPLADSVSLSRDVPPLALADKLEEVDRLEDATFVRQLVA